MKWAVIPDIRHWRGDARRNTSPYFIAPGITYGDLNIAQYAKRELNKRGIACYVDAIA